MTSQNTNSVEDEKKQLADGIVVAFYRGISEYEQFSNTELAQVSHCEASRMGNFTDPETGKTYGFKLTIGRPDFFDEPEDEGDSDDE